MGKGSRQAAKAMAKAKQEIESGKTFRSQKPSTWRRKVKRK